MVAGDTYFSGQVIGSVLPLQRKFWFSKNRRGSSKKQHVYKFLVGIMVVRALNSVFHWALVLSTIVCT